MMKIGALQIWPLYDGQVIFPDPGFPDMSSPELAVHRKFLTQDGRWVMDIGAFLVRSGDRVIVIDAGAGPGTLESIGPPKYTGLDDADPRLVDAVRRRGLTGEKLSRSVMMYAQTQIRHGALGSSLARCGVSPEEVTDVFLSHLHHDHIGWVSKDGTPYFPNATIRCDRRDIDYFFNLDESIYNFVWGAIPATERLAPVRDRFEPWDGDTAVAPGVNAVFAPGHTPGHTLFVLSSGSQRAMILGDAVHCPLELTDPDFSIMGDMDQALADRTRTLIRREMEERDTPAAAPHFPGLQFGRLLLGQGKGGWTFFA